MITRHKPSKLTKILSDFGGRGLAKCAQREGRKGGRGKRKPVGMAKEFDSGIYVMFKLTIWIAGTNDRVIINFEL